MKKEYEKTIVSGYITVMLLTAARGTGKGRWP